MLRTSCLAALALGVIDMAPAGAVTLLPTDSATVVGNFPSLPDPDNPGNVVPDPDFFDCMSDHGPGTGVDRPQLLADTQGFPSERRANAEFALTPGLPGRAPTRATFSFDYDGLGGALCLIGYRGDGVVSENDFTPADRVLIDKLEIFTPPDEGHVDLSFTSSLLSAAPAFLGLQIAVDEGSDTRLLLSNLRLTITDVPEPAVATLLSLGVLGLAALRRRV